MPTVVRNAFPDETHSPIVNDPHAPLYDRNGTANDAAQRLMQQAAVTESDLAIAPLDPIGPVGNEILDARMSSLDRHNARLSNSVFQVLEVEDNMPVLFDTQNSDAFVLMPLDRYLKNRHKMQAMRFNLKQINLRLHEARSHQYVNVLAGAVVKAIKRGSKNYETALADEFALTTED